MNIEKPGEGEMYTPEQKAALENDRTVSDAELIKGGARWKLNETTDEKANLEITEDQAINMKMEREGGVVDNLGTYIRMNKIIGLPFDSKEVAEQKGLKEILEQSKGKIWINGDYTGNYEGTFVDKDGNVAKFTVDREGSGIKSLSEEARTAKGVTGSIYAAIIRQLNELGFNNQEHGINPDFRITAASEKYKRAIEKEHEDSKDKGFNF